MKTSRLVILQTIWVVLSLLLSSAAVAGPLTAAPSGVPPTAEVVDVPIAGLTATSDAPTELGNTTAFAATITAGTNVAYLWNFGDGSPTGAGSNPTHKYSAAGAYTVAVTATNSVSSASAQTPVTVVDVPIAGLVAATDGPTLLGDTTTFTAIAAGTNIIYEWDFGDGSPTAIGRIVGHRYESVGTYFPQVTASNSRNSAQVSTIVDVLDLPVSGLLAAGDGPTLLGAATSFTATVTGGTNVTYRWDFGDNTPLAHGAAVSHPYAAIGTYRATVTASNLRGGVDATVSVDVLDAPIAGLAAAYHAPALLGRATAFTATAGSGTNVVYTWDFGDGAAGSGATPSHTYGASGVYNVAVTATNSSNFKTAALQVRVVVPVSGVTIMLPNRLPVNETARFTCSVAPSATTLPLTYKWEAGGQAPIVHENVNSLADQASFTWTTPGPRTVKVTVTGPGGTIESTRSFTVYHMSYLPAIRK